ncbi:uncharacterized protein PV09_04973 [Verruconis gallopava]|uniref:NAD(P)-binding protein n=1 Tax=Verruconis gallopava TaxID=253628 RepID=A0A0D2AAN9_9PEZI|nr:uncharacterized protein PV09_04973 [Verruconis gallopava]KIW03650.1 hypothetical protein PV09_04973 [Verruconis gallopava]
MGAKWTQFFPPKPALTKENFPSQAGKVLIVTGGNTGIGFELVKILYSKGGTVYTAARSVESISNAITSIKSECQTSEPKGKLKSLVVNLSDLNLVSVAAASFLGQETRLDVLFNNAGIAQVPAGSLSTARNLPKGWVRIVWTSSSIVDIAGPPGGVSLDELIPGNYNEDKAHNYSASKAGNRMLASEFSKRHCESEGIISITQNPGNLKTKSWDTVPLLKFIFGPLLHDARFGAYTEIWCGMSEEVKVEDGGRFAIPWGRWHPDPRKDVLESLKGKD